MRWTSLVAYLLQKDQTCHLSRVRHAFIRQAEQGGNRLSPPWRQHSPLYSQACLSAGGLTLAHDYKTGSRKERFEIRTVDGQWVQRVAAVEERMGRCAHSLLALDGQPEGEGECHVGGGQLQQDGG